MTADAAASPVGGNDGTGAITMADGVEIDVGGGVINLTAAEDITVGRLVTTNASSTAIQLTSTNGGIVDAGDTGGADIVAAGRLVVNAATGFGNAGAIETTVASVDITAGAGAIRIVETDGLTLTSLSNTNTFDLDITAGATMTVVTAYTRTGAGQLIFQVLGADQNLNVTNALQTATGTIDLQARGNVVLGANADLTTTSATITVKADIDANTTGALTMADGTVFASATGLIDMCAGGDITLGRITTGNATVNAVTLLSTDGEIIDGGDTGGEDIVTSGGGRINLTADNGIGHGGAVDVDTTLLALTNTNNGGGNRNIEINSTGSASISLTSVSHSGTGIFDTDSVGDLSLDGVLTRVGVGTITLESHGGSLNIDNAWQTASGAVNMRAAENIVLTGNGDGTSTSGNLILSADHDFGSGGVQNDGTGAVTMADGTVINMGSGTISVTADENITVGQLITSDNGAMAVSLTSAAGGIVDAGDTGGADIQAAAGMLAVSAASGFGNAGALEATVSAVNISAGAGAIRLTESDGVTLTATTNNNDQDLELQIGGAVTVGSAISKTSGDISIVIMGDSSLNVQNTITTGTGGITLSAEDDVIFTAGGDITSVSGNIVVTADSDSDDNGSGGAVTMVDGTLFDAGSGTITLSADEDIDIGGLLTTNVGATAVQVTSTSGSITDAGDTHVDVSAANGSLVVNADAGIGVGGALETTLAGINLTTGSGVIQISESNALDIDNISAGAGDVTITASGAIDIDGSLDSTSGNILITAGNDTSINVNNTITTTGGDIALAADDDVIFSGAGDLTSGGGNVSVTADNDSDSNGSGGILTMVDGTVINAGAGTVALSSDESISVGRIITTDNGATAVQITSSSGGVIDAGDTGGVDIQATAGTLAVSAATGFGSSGALETQVSAVNISAGAGNIQIVESDGLTLTGLSNTSTFDINLSVGTALALGTDLSRTGAGNLTVAVTGTNQALTVNTTQSTVSGSLNLSATGNVGFGDGVDLASTSGNISITADSEDDDTGALTMHSGTLINAGSGRIALDAGEDITLGAIQTMNADSGGNAVTFTSSAGGVVDGSDVAVNIVANSGTVSVNVASGFGASVAVGGAVDDAIETTISTASITTTAGEIDFVESDGITLSVLSAANTANVTVTTGGATNLNATLNNKTSGNISVTVGGDTSLAVTTPIITTSGTVSLLADDDVTFTAGADITTSTANITITADNDSDASGTGGTITMADGTLFNAGSGRIIINADEDIILGGLLTTNADAGGNAVVLVSGSGGIEDAGDSHVEVVANSGTLDVTSAAGFGDGGAIETTVSEVDITANAGAIRIAETDGVTLTATTNDNDQDLELQFGGSSTVSGAISKTTGDVAIALTGNGSSLNVQNTITTGSGNITLSAEDDVIFTAGGDLTSTSGNISVTADSDSDDNGSGGALTMANGTLFDAGSGTVTLSADEDVTLGGLLTTNAGVTAVQVTSTSGSILDGGDTHTDVSAANGDWVGIAETGIGVGNSLEMQVVGINLTTNTGVVAVDEADALDIDGINATIGDVTIIASGGVDVGGAVVSTSGQVSITAGSDSILNVNNTVITVLGNITLAADSDVIFTSAGDITSTSGDVSVIADNDSDANGIGGAITMADGSVLNAGSGTITFDADEDITLGRLVTTDTTNSAVALTSSSGGIVDGGDTGGNDIEATVGRLTVSVVTGFGSDNAIETNVNDMLINAGAGAIRFIEEDAVILSSLSNTSSFDMDISVGDDFTVTSSYDRTGAGALLIEVTGVDNNLTVDSAQLTGAGNMTFKATADVIYGANSDLISTSGTITVLADSDNSGTGGITMDSGSAIDSGSGKINFDAVDDIVLGSLTTTNNDVDAVTIDTAKAIRGNSLAAPNITSTSGTTSIRSSSVGTPDEPLEVAINTLIFNTSGGDVNFSSDESFQIENSSTEGGNVNFVILNLDEVFESQVLKNVESGSGSITLNNNVIGEELVSSNDIEITGATIAELLESINEDEVKSDEDKKNNNFVKTANNSSGSCGSSSDGSGESGNKSSNVSAVSLPGSAAIWSDSGNSCDGEIKVVKGVCVGGGCMVQATDKLVFFVPSAYEVVLEPVIIDPTSISGLLQTVMNLR